MASDSIPYQSLRRRPGWTLRHRSVTPETQSSLKRLSAFSGLSNALNCQVYCRISQAFNLLLSLFLLLTEFLVRRWLLISVSLRLKSTFGILFLYENLLQLFSRPFLSIE